MWITDPDVEEVHPVVKILDGDRVHAIFPLETEEGIGVGPGQEPELPGHLMQENADMCVLETVEKQLQEEGLHVEEQHAEGLLRDEETGVDLIEEQAGSRFMY